MNITLLHYSAPPVVGGVESVLAHHARLMADAGHHACVVAGRGAQFDARIPFIALPLADSRHPDVLAVKAELDAGRVSPEFDDLTAQLTATLDKLFADTDIVIAHNVCSLHKNLALTAALWRLAKLRHPRLILWHHDLAWTTPRYRAELHAGFPWDLLRRDWPDATYVVVSSLRQQELAGLLGVPHDRITVVPNGVDAPTFLKLEAQTRVFVRQLNLLEAAPLLLLPVRLTPRKNIELALHTLGVLREAYPRAALLVTGPLGPHNPANAGYFARLKALRAKLGLEEAAHFLTELSEGYLPDAVIADFYRLADALVLPSREEGFGIPLLEAGLARLPIFCADIPPLRELGGETAHYFSPDMAPAQVAALIADHLAHDPIFNLRERLLQHYTWERVYAR
ncbi:MAG: glycosyltransferase family 4 protein, partial [Anaerolineales bacterium]